MRYYKKLIGKKCYLSPINIDDAEKYLAWLCDLEVSIYFKILSQQLTIEKEKEILTTMSKNQHQTFGIIDIKTDKLIGNCSLFSIDKIDRKAEFGIFIGDKNYWGKGYGTEAGKLIVDYGFNALNIHSIMLETYSFNKRAIKSYEKIGFKVIGKRREAKIIGKKKFDVIYMDILSHEFESVYIKKLLEKIEDENM